MGRSALTPDGGLAAERPGSARQAYSLAALTPATEEALAALADSSMGPLRAVERARALLALRSGMPADAVALKVGRSVRTIRRWENRFAEEGVKAVFDARRSGRPPRLTTQDVMTICEVAVAEPESLGVPLKCWSLRRLSPYLANHKGIQVKPERLRQILNAHNVRKKEEVSKQRSKDPNFTAKRDAVVELYTHPPEDSLVLCMDQLGPLSLHATPGQKYAGPGESPRHDAQYKRHGTIYTLGALLPHLGTVFARAFKHYNSLTVIWFLGWLLPQLPGQARTVYIILDNASAHTAKRVQQWLTDHWSDPEKHPRIVHLIFTPSQAAWLNLIEPFWGILKQDMYHGSDYHSTAEFRTAQRQYLAFYNSQCHPFIWGRERKARVLLLRPVRKELRGRAGARAMPARLLRLIARAAA